MDGLVTGETDELIGVSVIDNEGIEHIIDVRKSDGKITAHNQDGYADNASKRSPEGHVHVKQAGRFAKYWVHRKRGYDTLDSYHNPDHITAAAVALAPLTPETAEQHLEDLYTHLRSINGDDSAESTVEVPDGVDPSRAVYRKDIYLGFDDQTLAGPTARMLADDQLMDLIGKSVSVGGERPPGAELVPTFDELLAAATDRDPDSLPDLREGLLLDYISDTHLYWEDSSGDSHTHRSTQPARDRQPDARVEIFSYDPESITELQKQIARHLLCQVRDCYLTMGIAPPEQFRLLGHGRHDATSWYVNYDYYDEYVNPNANVSTWFEGETPDGAYEHEADEPKPTVEH